MIYQMKMIRLCRYCHNGIRFSIHSSYTLRGSPGVSALEPLESTPWKFLNGDCIENGALEKVFPFEYGYLG